MEDKPIIQLMPGPGNKFTARYKGNKETVIGSSEEEAVSLLKEKYPNPKKTKTNTEKEKNDR